MGHGRALVGVGALAALALFLAQPRPAQSIRNLLDTAEDYNFRLLVPTGCDSYRILFNIDLMAASPGLGQFFAQMLEFAASRRYPDSSVFGVGVEWSLEKASEADFGDFPNNCTLEQSATFQRTRYRISVDDEVVATELLEFITGTMADDAIQVEGICGAFVDPEKIMLKGSGGCGDGSNDRQAMEADGN